jgi:hypothetical protein
MSIETMVFEVGLVIVATILYFLIERYVRKFWWIMAIGLLGVAAIAYPIYRHFHPSSLMLSPSWIFLLLLLATWGLIWYDIRETQRNGEIRPIRTVHRWWNQSTFDHFYTLDPAGEQAPMNGYTYDGAKRRFKLFPTGTVGTTPFYRLFNPATRHHFYTSDPHLESALNNGFHLEGVIGNIAASQLPGTVALSHWFHSGKGNHFYTTDLSGELASTLGYHFQGISGYVQPR